MENLTLLALAGLVVLVRMRVSFRVQFHRSKAMAENMLTTGEVAKRFGCKRWMIQRLFERELLADTFRTGTYRVIPESQLAKVEKVAREAGYVK